MKKLLSVNGFYLALIVLLAISISALSFSCGKGDDGSTDDDDVTIGCVASPTGKGGEMCIVPAGKFWMGCNAAVETQCNIDERPYHEVYLDGFYIDKYEVTASQYKACVTAGKCTAADKDYGCNYNLSGKKNHPINCVDWNQAKAYCGWVGKRLPTEAEWEKAARGTDGRKYPWGNEALDCNRAVHQVDPCTASGTAIVGIMTTGVSFYGAFDMVGNVWEWVNDWYGESYYSSSPSSNPPGPSSGTERVLRGGSWSIDDSTYLRASSRLRTAPGFRIDLNGFRCVVSAQ